VTDNRSSDATRDGRPTANVPSAPFSPTIRFHSPSVSTYHPFPPTVRFHPPSVSTYHPFPPTVRFHPPSVSYPALDYHAVPVPRGVPPASRAGRTRFPTGLSSDAPPHGPGSIRRPHGQPASH